MLNLINIFEQTLSNAKNENISLLIEDCVFSLVYKKTKEERVRFALDVLLEEFLKTLKKLNMLNQNNATSVIKALIKAQIAHEENKLYQYIDELSLIQSKIERQKEHIKNEISQNFFELEKSIQNSDFKEELQDYINEAILFEVETLDILKEIIQSALITTLEKNEDIEFTATTITKNLMYNAICESNFEKERILSISKTILHETFELANESKNYAKDLCIGVVKGIEQGIEQGIEKFKTSFKYCVLEEDLSAKAKQLVHLEDEFIELLRYEIHKNPDPIKSILQDLLNNEFNTLFSKLKRLATESREQIFLSLNDLKKNPKINDFNKLAQSKINSFKQEISELEKFSSYKYKDFNSKKAKNIGIALWKKAKNLIKK
ncbi:hypothetical protein [Campylobacter sp. CCS1377]|uniref:Uncharacterized protein n=1 Tax=Campylobacter sp. CCS1377 TaxID=3158229 RepID=A0AAU7E8F7_9BACT|nr:hypothetical protein [Campylobacter jejuni]